MTRHNEVAPSQFEMAPVFEETDVAVDHNQLVMATLRKVALRHGLQAVLHEKPFAGINGSGKHCNWSMAIAADNELDGINLLKPGRTPHQNLRFLLFLAAVLKGVHKHAGVLRAGIGTSGNEHRLGAPALFRSFGVNAIAAYAGAWMCTVFLEGFGWMSPLYAHGFGWLGAWLGPHAQSLGFALAFVGVWWLIVRELDRRRWYWKI